MVLVILVAAGALLILYGAFRIILAMVLTKPALASFDRGVAEIGSAIGKIFVLVMAAGIVWLGWALYKAG